MGIDAGGDEGMEECAGAVALVGANSLRLQPEP